MAAKAFYEFGPYRLELPMRRLLREGVPVPLSPKAFETLRALIDRRDRVVEKSELMELLWPDAFVEDGNLSQTIFVLRKALGEAPGGRQYIDTIPRRGYRFAVAACEDGLGRDAEPEPMPAEPVSHRWIAVVLSIAALLLLILSSGDAVVPKSVNAAPHNRTMLAVLPFENLTGDPAQEYFSDGLTEEMIAQLGRVHPARLGVIARTSVMTYKRRSRRVDQIGAELHVDYVLEGSVRRAGSRVSIAAQLIQVKDQTQLWRHDYEGDLEDLLTLQGGVASDVAAQIASELAPETEPRRTNAGAIDPDAYQLYLKGRYFANKRTTDGLIKALAYFQQSLAADRGYAQAYVGLSDSYLLASTFSVMSAAEALPKAREAALKALAIDSRLGEPHASLAFLEWIDCEWVRAEKHFKDAIDLAPAYPTAHHWYALFLKDLGRFDEAIAEIKRAEVLDPLSLVIKADVALVFYFARRPAEAMTQLQQTLDMDPTYELARAYVGWVYEQQGKYSDAIATYMTIPGIEKMPTHLAMLCRAYALAGRRREAIAVLDQMTQLSKRQPVPASKMTVAYAVLDDHDTFFRWLKATRQEGPVCMAPFSWDPRFDLVRSDPRFVDLLKRQRY